MLSKIVYDDRIMINIKQLAAAGLDEKQARVYVACLELGKSKAPEIARKAEIKRTTSYNILDELMRMGLVSYSTQGKSKFFVPQEPRVILNMLDTKRKLAESLLPELEMLHATHHIRPKLQFFEGREGVKRIYEDTLTAKSKKLQQIVRVKDFFEFPGKEYLKNFIQRRVAAGITAYALHPKSDDIHDDTFGEESTKHMRHVRYLPPGLFHASMIMIYDNKVAMISTREESFGFIIESKDFSSTLAGYFEFLWNAGTKEAEE